MAFSRAWLNTLIRPLKDKTPEALADVVARRIHVELGVLRPPCANCEHMSVLSKDGAGNKLLAVCAGPAKPIEEMCPDILAAKKKAADAERELKELMARKLIEAELADARRLREQEEREADEAAKRLLRIEDDRPRSTVENAW